MNLYDFLSKLCSIHTIEIWDDLDLDADLDVIDKEDYKGPCSDGMLFSFRNLGQIGYHEFLKEEYLNMFVEIVYVKRDGTICVGVKGDIANE